MRKLMKNTSPSVPSISTIITGPLKIAWPNVVRPVIPEPVTVIAEPPAAWNVNQATRPVSATAAAM
jgi:hypothetical protein